MHPSNPTGSRYTALGAADAGETQATQGQDRSAQTQATFSKATQQKQHVEETMTALTAPPIGLPDLDDGYVDAAELDRLYALKLDPKATASLQDIRDLADSLMSEGERPFASDQILRHIKEYLSKTYGQGEYDTLLAAAYHAG